MCTYVLSNQPVKMPLNKISWHPDNRGGQGIMPFHVHDGALDICTRGTSKRRYNQVRMVEVPKHIMKKWLFDNEKKAEMNPLLASFQAMSHTRPVYATLVRTHFVEAHTLISESGRTYRNQADGLRLCTYV